MSSLVFGTFVGAMADKYGRKKLCMAFGVFYSASCVTKLFNDFNILLLGRVLSGISTSLLFSTFESWMISEHNSRRFPPELISDTFALATFGNGIVAIAAGLMSSFAADSYGFVSPFMIALVLLIAGTIYVSVSWNENYGDSKVDLTGTFTSAITAMRSDPKVLLLGLVQALFEASMYTFVFMWTPALQAVVPAEGEKPVVLPFGLIFACFMVSIMIGSALFSIMLNKFKWTAEEIGRILLFIAAISLLIPLYFYNFAIVSLSFLLFEVCCGIYFPCFGTLRGKYIPENSRAAVMNFFRVPLNFLVVVVLVKVGSLSNSTVFLLCSLWLGLAFLLQNQLQRLSVSSSKEEDSNATSATN